MAAKTKKDADVTSPPAPVVHIRGREYGTALCGAIVSITDRAVKLVASHDDDAIASKVTCADCLRIHSEAEANRKAKDDALKAKRTLERQRRNEMKDAVRAAKLNLATRLGSPSLEAGDAVNLAKALATLQNEDDSDRDDDYEDDED